VEPIKRTTPVASRSGTHGVWELATGQASAITPSSAYRQKRRQQRKLQRMVHHQEHPEFSSLLDSLMNEPAN
jgi:hypothetical protein